MSVWQSKELATAYLDGIRGAIPAADVQFAVIHKIVELWSNNPSAILDLGCGDGILGRSLFSVFPSAQSIFVDFSDEMLDVVRKKIGRTPNARVIKADFSTPQWIETVSSDVPFDIILSGFSIHHQPDERKKVLYAEIYDVLAPGGVFLNLEHVASSSLAGEKLFDEYFVDHLFDYHSKADPETTREKIASTYDNRSDKSENKLAPVDQQCQWLRDIGFHDVDCFFKVFELALIGGRKSSIMPTKM